MERVELLFISMIGGVEKVTGEIYGRTPEIVAVCWVILLVMVSLTAISIKVR